MPPNKGEQTPVNPQDGPQIEPPWGLEAFWVCAGFWPHLGFPEPWGRTPCTWGKSGGTEFEEFLKGGGT